MERPRKLFKVSFVIFRCHKYLKKIHGNDKKNFPRNFKKCTGLLHLPLLVWHGRKGIVGKQKFELI